MSEQPRVRRGGGLGVRQHLDVLGYRGERSGAVGGAVCRVGQLDPYAVLRDGQRGDGEVIVVKLGRVDGAPLISDQDVRVEDQPPGHGSVRSSVSRAKVSARSASKDASGGV